MTQPTTQQTVSQTEVREFIRQIPPFDRLSSSAIDTLLKDAQLLRYPIGRPILVHDKLPIQISIIYDGQVRLLGHDQRVQTPISLRLAGPGEVLGWAGLVRGVPCETAIASRETICLNIPADTFLSLLKTEAVLRDAFQDRCSLNELFDLVGLELQRRADGTADLKALTAEILPDAVVCTVPPGGKVAAAPTTGAVLLDPDRIWLISAGSVGEIPTGGRVSFDSPTQLLTADRTHGVRLVGIRELQMPSSPAIKIADSLVVEEAGGESTDDTAQPAARHLALTEIPYGPPQPPEPPTDPLAPAIRYPFVRGRGPVEAPLACFQMLSQLAGVNFRKDLVRKVVVNQLQTRNELSLQACGAIAEMMGMRAQLVAVAAPSVPRLKGPAMVLWQDSYALLYSISEQEIVMAVPEVGIMRKRPKEFQDLWGEQGQVLLLQPPAEEQREKFSLRWFIPAMREHRKVLIEVFIASFFVQLFGLANPLITQVIIDKVLIQRSLATLDVLGVLMLVLALFEALLTSLRTYLFVDTTNRIDLKLGSEVINHLLRLPLSYFDNRRVGELAGRVHELERIRQFLTGTVLTVVLDAVFSVVYIAVMLLYSWLLTVIAMATVPAFAILALIVSPLVRRMLRRKAERAADTESYLVEVLSGIQTVKAQNIELKARWSWQEKYARYIGAGFRTVLTFTTASSISGFLQKLSGLLILWVGAHLVLTEQLTLGQLIAFRIISGYVTSPLLRLVQLWQNFQETALSIERLSDILDAHPESDEVDRTNIPMPPIIGAVKYEDVSFRFNPSGPLQVVNVNLEFEPGMFVGIVGQSGSGKSTLMKLLQRLYEPTAGRIQIDGYDISKVELYSLRRQIGVVLQDTLLFNGTVQENIALTNPEATTDEIIKAAKIAAAHDFIMTLPNGYNTVVGERGASLSGGQRQRIAIARTVLQNPHLLILDEATSALDYNSERQVCQNLAEAFEGRTVFFITHRLSTVRNADRILMMDQGSVVEEGTHEELMALRGRYYCLYQQQESQL